MQGFNMGRYVPPDLEGTVSFNAASGKGHALGARARKLKTEGILTVRFECPFAIWCTTCSPEEIIGQGVRFNAEKKKVGAYFSTPVWQFRFKHTTCGGWIEVRTDPKNAEYVVVAGGRRRDTGDADTTVGRASEADRARLEGDGAFGALEKALEDKRVASAQQVRLEGLMRASERAWADPYEQSRRLRAQFRVGRRKRQADERSGAALQDKFGLGVEVVAPDEADEERVAFVDFGPREEPEAGGSSASGRRPMFGGAAPSTLAVGSKEALQSQLRGNTRAAADPFLRGEEDGEQWAPRAKRTKKKTTEAEGEHADLPGGDTKATATAATAGTVALVGYDSDSS